MSNNDDDKIEFHMRNCNTTGKVEFRIYHMGGAQTPWRDNRPGCWKESVPYNINGGSNSVYVPNNFVVNFGHFWKMMVDSFKAVEQMAIWLGSDCTDEESLENALMDIYNVSQDAAKQQISNSGFTAQQFIQAAQENFIPTCEALDIDPAVITAYASHINPNQPNAPWVFIGGSTYQVQVFKDNKEMNGNHGWSVYADDDHHWRANHAFVNNGHFIQFYDNATKTKLWQKTH